MKKYNLKFWDRVTLPLLWVYWKLSLAENKKTWHEVKKGLEPHKCNFTKTHWECGYRWRMCEHEGCNTVEPNDYRL